MKYLLPATLLLLGLGACQSPSSSPDQHVRTAAKAPTSAAAPAAANSPGTAYRVYRGLLPGQSDSVTLHLVTAPQAFFALGGAGHHGSYYGPDGHPYEVQSQPSAPDSLVLNDISPEHSTSGSSEWRLVQQPSGLAGTIGGQAVRLRLVPTPAGGLTFGVRYLADSLAANPKDPKSPKARISLQALVPTGGPAAGRQALGANLLRDLRGDTLGGQAPLALPALFAQQRQAYFKDYRADTADMPAPTDTADLGSYRASLNYTSQQATYVLYQQGDLLSLGFFTYDYTGGAHGTYGTTGASYDLRTGRRLRYDDIFQPTAAAKLPALLATAVRPLVGLERHEALDKQLLVKQMPITHNIFLTASGVEFIYQPYEIASYAQGEVRIFLPLGQIRALLREGLPLPTAPSVAATR